MEKGGAHKDRAPWIFFVKRRHRVQTLSRPSPSKERKEDDLDTIGPIRSLYFDTEFKAELAVLMASMSSVGSVYAVDVRKLEHIGEEAAG